VIVVGVVGDDLDAERMRTDRRMRGGLNARACAQPPSRVELLRTSSGKCGVINDCRWVSRKPVDHDWQVQGHQRLPVSEPEAC
jgi:hypothetical protein